MEVDTFSLMMVRPSISFLMDSIEECEGQNHEVRPELVGSLCSDSRLGLHLGSWN